MNFVDSPPSFPCIFRLLEVFPLIWVQVSTLIFASRLYYCTVLYFVVGLDIIESHAGTQNIYDEEEEVRSPYCLFNNDASNIPR